MSNEKITSLIDEKAVSAELYRVQKQYDQLLRTARSLNRETSETRRFMRFIGITFIVSGIGAMALAVALIAWIIAFV